MTQQLRILVKEVQEEGRWKEEKMANHILHYIKPPTGEEDIDKVYWKLNTRGTFLVKSAYQKMRQRKHPRKIYENIWTSRLPIKISFFMWRL